MTVPWIDEIERDVAYDRRSVKGLGSHPAIERDRQSVCFLGLFVAGVELGDMGRHFLRRRPACQEVAQHLLGSLRRFATCPQRDQQAGDDRTVGLDP